MPSIHGSLYELLYSKNALHRRRKRGGGGGGGQGGPNLGGGANIPFGPPNNPPAFSFNLYVKREKIRNVPR